MKRIVVLLCYVALVMCDSSNFSILLINGNYPSRLCYKDFLLKQGTYKCVEKSPSDIHFNPQTPIGDNYYNIRSVRQVCQKDYQFLDTETSTCVSTCVAPKIKNYINGSCETKGRIRETLPKQAIYSFESFSVSSEESVIQVQFENIDYFRYDCPLIDFNTRKCMKTIEECTGFVINQIYCKQCDCDNEINENDELCLRKCSCNHLFYQQLSIDDLSDATENTTENIFVCKPECQKDFGSEFSNKKTSNFVRLGKLCIPETECPYLVIDNSICSKTCGPLKKKYIHFNEKQGRCIECQRREKNGLCSDVCSNFNEMLFFDFNSFQEKCKDRQNYTELALINNQGCLFPLVLSVDGSQCLRECPSGQKHVHIKNSILSKCISSDECEPGYFESSNGKECVDLCDKLIEEGSKGSNKCTKCTDCERKKSLNEQAKNLERILNLFNDNEVIHYIDRIGEQIQRIFNSIKKLPTDTFTYRFQRFNCLRDYLQAAIVYHHQRLFLLDQSEKTFYFDMKKKSGYGIEEKDIYISYYQFEIMKGSISSVKFQQSFSDQPIHRIKYQIARSDNIKVCFNNDIFCKEATIFYNLNVDASLIPIFEVQPEIFDDLYCVHEEFRVIREVSVYISFLTPAKRISDQEFKCNSFTFGGIGLVSLSKEEVSEYQRLRKIDETTGEEFVINFFQGILL